MHAETKNVPVFILAGGLGTRIAEGSHLKPKPMIEIGDIPILVHIMRWYYSFGFETFVICAGFKAWSIKEYFLNYEFRRNHLVIDHRVNGDSPPFVINRCDQQERWQVMVVDTGQETFTGGRIARALDEVKPFLNFQNFAVTYGDGVSDIPLDEALSHHLAHGQIGTVAGVPPVARFGELDIAAGGCVEGFIEKPQDRQGLINGGFFFFKKDFRSRLSSAGDCVLEQQPLAELARDKNLMVYRHTGFWHPMDTQRDRMHLQEIWDSGRAPWAPRRPDALDADMASDASLYAAVN